jgi:iron(III) transport system permease protein
MSAATESAAATREKIKLVNRPRAGGLTPKTLSLAAILVLVAYITIPPVVTLIAASFQSDFLSATSYWTIENYLQTFTEPATFRMLVNSLIYASGTTFFATSIGATLAWLFVRSDAPFRRFIFLTAMLPFVIPGLLNTFAYIFLMSPQIGLMNYVFESLIGVRPFVIYSLPGMILVQTLNLTPLAFGLLSSVFRSMDATLEESAKASGASSIQVIKNITVPLAAPGIFSAALLIFVETISGFEVANLIGVPGGIFVFVSSIYEALVGYPTDFGGASTLSTVVIAIAVSGIFLSNRMTRQGDQFVTVSGKGYKPQRLPLGPWKWVALAFVAFYFTLAVLLPLLILLWVSLLSSYQAPSLASVSQLSFANYLTVLRYPRILESLMNSLTVTVIAAAVVMAVTSAAAYVSVKTKLKGRATLDSLIFIPVAIPGTILGVSILFWYLMAPLPFSLYGTLSILVIGFVTLYLPYGMRFMAPATVQIGKELEEAAMVSGAGWGMVIRRIYFPLLTGPAIGGFLFIVILAFREISAAVFLYAQDTRLFSLTLYDFWGEGLFGYVSALGIMMVLAFTSVIAIAQRLLGQTLISRSGR